MQLTLGIPGDLHISVYKKMRNVKNENVASFFANKFCERKKSNPQSPVARTKQAVFSSVMFTKIWANSNTDKKLFLEDLLRLKR